jgi:RHS repeat-associated protein
MRFVSIRPRCWLALLAPGLYAAIALGQPVSTTTTRYTYNADGALTQVVEQVDDDAPTTTYLTWDNFVPNAGDPATGTVLPGNGNLVAVGPEPGVDAASRSFAFDGEDRLIRYTDANGSVRYRFHPTWLMASSTLDGGDSRYFYYDDAEAPQMTNVEDGDSGLMCSEMGDVRSLSDGGLQILLSPRKDVAGVYDPAQGTFSAYHYDAFGDEGTSNAAPASYDLYDNQQRYAGEYKDPTWGGYYLRARWYDPRLHTFLSRDPMANLNRYNYADGNPVSRVDPDGKKSRHWGSKPWRWGAAAKWVNKQSAAGHIWDRIFLAPVIGPLGLIPEPGSFFYQQVHSAGGFRGEVTFGTLLLEVGADVLTPELGLQSFAFRLLTDVTVGDVASNANAISHGGSKFSWRSFAQGMEYTAGSMFYTRLVAGRGYRPFTTSVDDIVAADNEGEANVYRVKRPVSVLDTFSSGSSTQASRSVLYGAGPGFRTAGPIGDMINMSLQHEFLIAVAHDGSSLVSEVLDTGFAAVRLDPDATDRFLARASRGKASYLKTMDEEDAVHALKRNPLRMHLMAPNDVTRAYPANLQPNFGAVANYGVPGTNFYDPFNRNCMRHVAKVIGGLRR